MTTATRVIKAPTVKLDGKFQMSLTPTQSQPQPLAPHQNFAHPHARKIPTTQTTKDSVEVIENTAEYVTLEITCTCGEKTRLKCRYAQPLTTGTAEHIPPAPQKAAVQQTPEKPQQTAAQQTSETPQQTNPDGVNKNEAN